MAKFFETNAGKVTAGIGAVVFVGLAIYVILGNTAGSVVVNANTRMFVDSESGKAFPHDLTPGETSPIESPFSHKKTAYEAEKCYWTRDGKPKAEPTYVLLNSTLGKAGPTFCPDCGRLVIPHNPPAAGSDRPPPLESEYTDRGGGDRNQR